MPRVDVIDGVIVDASPMVAFKAILDEYSGVTSFWKPIIEFKPRANKRVDCEAQFAMLQLETKESRQSLLPQS